ncbi:MAG: peptide cleavage/export ABC transporter, partial [Clostridiales bacterium]|nr:peptide cleavage/export ABC transporter [Clostridiales bacterium]
MFNNYTCIRQHDMTDCAAACLASISKHYKLNIPIARIRELAGTDRDGTNVTGIIKAATELGFSAKGVKGDRKAFFSKFPLPVIAHVLVRKSLLHYVVVYKISPDEVIIADPARGIVHYTPAQFLKLWTGVLVIITPNQSFKTGDVGQTTLTKFFSLLIPQRGLLLNIFFTSVLLTALGILTSFYFQLLMDDILPNSLQDTLMVVSLGIVALHLFQNLLTFFRSHLLVYLSQRLDINLIFAYYAHVLKLPMSFFGTRRVGEIISRFSDADRVRSAISSATLTIMFDTIMAVGGGIILYMRSPRMFGVTFTLAILQGAVM